MATDAQSHWQYSKELLQAFNKWLETDSDIFELLGFIYESAYEHGYKHGKEASDPWVADIPYPPLPQPICGNPQTASAGFTYSPKFYNTDTTEHDTKCDGSLDISNETATYSGLDDEYSKLKEELKKTDHKYCKDNH